MANLNSKGNGRGMGFKPRWAECKMCGEKFWKETARRVYCDGCREVRKEEMAEANRQRARVNYIRTREGLPPMSQVPKPPEPETGYEPHVCMMAGECFYGVANKQGCGYEYIENKLRTTGGLHRIIEGRCDLFRPRGERKPGWKDAKDKKLERTKGGVK